MKTNKDYSKPFYSEDGSWRIGAYKCFIESGESLKVADCRVSYVLSDANMEANAAFIVTACNSHAANLARIVALEATLKGAQKALRKALPYMADSDDSHYVGEWLDEVNSALLK